MPSSLSFFFLLIPRPPTSTLFPYTTLFRSVPWRVRWPGGSGRSTPSSTRCPGGTGQCICTPARSEEHTSELQSRPHLVCRLLLEKKKKTMQHAETLAAAAAGKNVSSDSVHG